MLEKQKVEKINYFKILLTGDNNYNNVNKFNVFMAELYENIPQVKTIATFGGKYGAEVLGQLYALANETNFRTFTTDIFRHSRKPSGQLYHILLDIAVKWSDLVVIFTNIYTSKVKNIIELCLKHDKEYLLIKE